MRQKLALILFAIFFPQFLNGQVKIRLLTEQKSEMAVFSVIEGEYDLTSFPGPTLSLRSGANIIILKNNNALVIKTQNSKGFICDSVSFLAKSGNDLFSLRVSGISPVKQYYSGDLLCIPDLGTLLFINSADIESYIAGVVKAEGGSGRNIEYFKTQAILTRTYMYRYFDRHANDRFNLCDNTHCQVFNGISNDSLIVNAAMATKGQVILGPDSTLIISAFHSNCGGETCSSEDVWLTGQSYLKKVRDPYCLTSRNAKWQRSISIGEWTGYLKKNGYDGRAGDTTLLNFSQPLRLRDYRTGVFTLPLRQIREDMNLRSTFFSLSVKGDSVELKGRGYGHGVGLCQEGAMVMASNGFDYKQIIGFYFTGVRVTDVKNALADK